MVPNRKGPQSGYGARRLGLTSEGTSPLEIVPALVETRGIIRPREVTP